MKLLSLALVLALLGLAFCPGSSLADFDPIVVKGTVKKVTASKINKRILAEVLVAVDAKGDYLFLLSKDARVSFSDKRPGKWSDLKADQRVSITYNGIVASSDPPQAGASAVVIERPAKTK